MNTCYENINESCEATSFSVHCNFKNPDFDNYILFSIHKLTFQNTNTQLDVDPDVVKRPIAVFIIITKHIKVVKLW